MDHPDEPDRAAPCPRGANIANARTKNKKLSPLMYAAHHGTCRGCEGTDRGRCRRDRGQGDRGSDAPLLGSPARNTGVAKLLIEGCGRRRGDERRGYALARRRRHVATAPRPRYYIDTSADLEPQLKTIQRADEMQRPRGDLETAKVLLDQGTDVNVVNCLGTETALLNALREKHPEVALLLVQHGADVKVQGGLDTVVARRRQRLRRPGREAAQMQYDKYGITR